MKDPYEEYLNCGVTPGNLEKSRTIQIGMGYPGCVISINHSKYRGGIYTKPEARTFRDTLAWLVKSQHIEGWKLPLTVRCDGVFKNKQNQPDLSNLCTIILNGIEDGSKINDRDMRWQDGDVSYGERAELIITITESG